MKTSLINKIIFCTLLVFVAISSNSFAQKTKNDFEGDSKKLSSALQIIDLFYVDTVSNNKLVETAITDMLKDLDPHSVYLSKEEMKEANEPLQGNFEGIGVQFSIVKDTIMVVSPTPGGPSEKLGIMPGDKIVLYTDGITEASDTNGQEFEEARIAAFAKANNALTASELNDRLLAQVSAFCGAQFQDDATLLVIAAN